MPIELVTQGPAFRIYEWVEGKRRVVGDFLEECEKRDADDLVTYLQRTADTGTIRNSNICKRLGDGIFEFRASRGARLLCFYDAGKIIICAHSFVKKRDDIPPRELQKAYDVQRRYQSEKKSG